MKKNLLKKAMMLLTSGAMILGMTMTAFAGRMENGTPGSWKQNEIGWWWETESGWWPSNGWWWIDGNDDGIAERYYFDGYGYLVTNKVTPGGYLVDADGKWVLEGVVPSRYVVGSGVAIASECQKDTGEIISYLQRFIGDRFIKMTSEDRKVKVSDSYGDHYKNGWLWYVYESNLQRFMCALAIDENGYLMTNATTPDGYQTDDYGRLVMNGNVVTHSDDCHMLSNSPVYDKTGRLITDKNGGWDPALINVSQNTWSSENLTNRMVPFGELIYVHVESKSWDAYGYGYGNCVQKLKETYPDRFRSDY